MDIFLLNNTDYVVAEHSKDAQDWYEKNTEMGDVTCDVVDEDFVITDWKSGVRLWASEYLSMKSLSMPFLIATTPS